MTTIPAPYAASSKRPADMTTAELAAESYRRMARALVIGSPTVAAAYVAHGHYVTAAVAAAVAAEHGHSMADLEEFADDAGLPFGGVDVDRYMTTVDLFVALGY